MITRRVLACLPILLLTRCSSSSSVSLDQLKAYADDLINALSATGEIYIASVAPGVTAASRELVTNIIISLQEARSALDAVTDITNARTLSLQILAFVNQITPILVPLMGPTAPYVPLAIALIQAFIQSLPPPPATPEKPPAQLHAAALRYHSKK